VLTPKIATVAARLLDGARDRVKADSNRTAAILTTLRVGDRRGEERKGKTESLSKQVEEKQEEKEAVNPCASLSPSQIPEERESVGLFAWICDTGTNCF
jgi:hypothetical protein